MATNNLKRATLAEVCSLVTDGTHDTPRRVQKGYPLIKAKEIGGGRIDFETCDHISQEEHLAVISRSKPELGDTLFAHIGASLGEAAYVNTNREFSIKNIALFKPNPEVIDGKYLYYLVISPQFQAMAKGTKTGSAQPFLSLQQLRTHQLLYQEDLTIQKRVGNSLSKYDDLIENNLQRIKILGQIAQTIFTEWFINFHFPSHEKVTMVQSGTSFGKIPEGWEIKNLFDVAEITYGFPFKSKLFTSQNIGKPVIRIRDIQENRTTTYTQQTADKKYIVVNGDLVVGMDGDFHMGKWSGGEAYLNQRVVRFRPKTKDARYFLFLSLKKPIDFFQATIVGTTVAHLSDADLKSINILVPSEKIFNQFNKLTDRLFSLEIALRVANECLRRSRDLLIPRLITGEIKL